MIASSSTRSVLFDVGGVLVDSHPDPLAVAALLGEAWHEVYDYALTHDFRFLSYGDSSLLLP